MNPTLQSIMKRTSVRDFNAVMPSKELLITIVKAGMAAPSGINKQPWAFIVVTARTMLDELGTQLPYAAMLKKSPAAIVVCGDLSKAINGEEDIYWIMDCSAAIQNILIAAESLGLGGVWTAVYPETERVEVVKEKLQLPDYIVPLSVVPIGYPTEKRNPKDKWKEENLHWERW